MQPGCVISTSVCRACISSVHAWGRLAAACEGLPKLCRQTGGTLGLRGAATYRSGIHCTQVRAYCGLKLPTGSEREALTLKGQGQPYFALTSLSWFTKLPIDQKSSSVCANHPSNLIPGQGTHLLMSEGLLVLHWLGRGSGPQVWALVGQQNLKSSRNCHLGL